MKKLLLIVTVALLFLSCQTTPELNSSAEQKTSYQKFYQVEQDGYFALCFNLFGENFIFKSEFPFSGLADLGDNLLMLQDEDAYYMVQVFPLTDFVSETGMVAVPDIHNSFYEFEKAYQLEQTNFDFSEGYEIIEIEGTKYLRFTYSNLGFSGEKDEVGRVISYGWISDQYYIQFFTPISNLENEETQETMIRKIITTYKAVEEPITEENIFTISNY